MKGLAGWFFPRRNARAGDGEVDVPAVAVPVDATQRDTIDDIVAIYETGKMPERAPYDTVAILKDGAGISYGFHQFTRGSLISVVAAYYRRGCVLRIGGEPLAAEQIANIIHRSTRVSSKPTSGEVRDLMDALEKAGEDPLMREAQREVAGGQYWEPTVKVGRALGLRYALSYLCLYDLSIHSGPPASVDDRLSRLYKLRHWPGFVEYPPSDSRTIGERQWVVGLCHARDEWLRSYPAGSAVATSAYRTQRLVDLCERGSADKGVWRLELPLEVRIRRPSGTVERFTLTGSPLDAPPTPRRAA